MFLGKKKEKFLYQKELEQIAKYDFSDLSEDELFNISDGLRYRVKRGESLVKIMPKAFALVKETVKRTLGITLYDTQLQAAVALATRHIIEMETGEGKTLAAVLPAYLNALTGKGVHILTFNDYLAKRDANWMGPIYHMLGITVGYITEEIPRTARKKIYENDVVYVCAKEAGFDYLRDFMANKKEDLVQREFYYAIVDEADSVLIDEARIPLVIAGSVKRDSALLFFTNSIVKDFEMGTHFTLNKYAEKASLTEKGLELAEELLGIEDLYSEENTETLETLLAALYAHYVLKKDKDYIVRDGDIEIVDEFTGRVAERRQYPDALQDAVRTKEGILSKEKSMILNSMPLQHFLNLYEKLAGMTGTANPAGDEFGEYYDLEIVRIEPYRTCIRKDLPDLVFENKEAKQAALIAKIAEVHKAGQPLLIGTGSVQESEELYQALKAVGIDCHVLNAKNDEQEAEIIKNAGAYGAVTVSTNMAGRGVDIKLGGFDERDYNRVADLGGLYVIGTNRNESRRIDNQLRGRAGRQGDPGQSQFFISLEDDMMVKYEVQNFLPEGDSATDENGQIMDKKITDAVAWLQRRVESYNESARIQLLKYTHVLELQRKLIHAKCMELLDGEVSLHFLEQRCPEKYAELVDTVGEEEAQSWERKITLYCIRKAWADYIDYMEYEKEGIHLVVIGRKDPVDEYNRIAANAFEDVKADMYNQVEELFMKAEIRKNGLDLEEAGLEVPAATWTYLINESKSQFSLMESFVKFVSGKMKK